MGKLLQLFNTWDQPVTYCSWDRPIPRLLTLWHLYLLTLSKKEPNGIIILNIRGETVLFSVLQWSIALFPPAHLHPLALHLSHPYISSFINVFLIRSLPWWQVPSSSWQVTDRFPIAGGSRGWHGALLWGWMYTGSPGRSQPVWCSTAPCWKISPLGCPGTWRQIYTDLHLSTETQMWHSSQKSSKLTLMILICYLMKTAVTKKVAIRPRQAKTTAAMGSGSPHRRYSTGIGSQPGDRFGEHSEL